MPYETEHLIRLEALQALAEITKSGLDTLTALERTLRTQIQAIEARQDADITAATEDSEIIDGRIDAWGSEHGSLGTNIRQGQLRLIEELDVLTANLQAQIQKLSEVRIEGLLEDVGASERRRQEISSETDSRRESDSWLQIQIQQLSEAELRMSVVLANIREALRTMKEE